MTAKEYLCEIKELDHKLIIAKEMQKESAVSKKATAEIERQLKKRMREAKKLIDRLNANEQEVLKRRYFLFQPFESTYDNYGVYHRGICDSMFLSPRQMYRIHKTALEKIGEMLEKNYLEA